jgi:hypothetical protein
LNIAGTRLDDEAVAQLKTLPNLKSVNVRNSGISYSGIDEWNQAVEGIEILE